MGSFDDIIFPAEDVIDFVGASLAEGGRVTVKERFRQFLFAAGTGLHFLHVWQGASSYCSMSCVSIIPNPVKNVTGFSSSWGNRWGKLPQKGE
jgi:hypothetical protein